MLTQSFLTAGNAVFTIKTPSDHYTYRIRKKTGDERYPDAWFIQLLTGPDNRSDYTYAGMLDPRSGRIIFTKASKVGPSAPSMLALQGATKSLWNNHPIPEGHSIYHEGSCGRCGRSLTDPQSIERGFGPECWDNL